MEAVATPVTRREVGFEGGHPHDLQSAVVPDRLPIAELRSLSRLAPGRALIAIATEWSAIAGAIALGAWAAHPLVTLAAVVLIGARQHALLVIAHDAAHFRMLPDRRWNDAIGNLLLAWPMFVSVQGFRHFHGAHHRFLAVPGDGNRALWATHDDAGAVTPEWRYPKSPAALAWKIARRAALWTGAFWLLRGVVGGFQFGVTPAGKVARAAWMLGVVAVLTAIEGWPAFALYWVLPYCTWHVAVQYVRLVCEHTEVGNGGGYELTRTTIPTVVERLLVLPRHIGYHIEHHGYPSVPFYRLPELHARLMREPGFAANARVSRSVWSSLREVTGRR